MPVINPLDPANINIPAGPEKSTEQQIIDEAETLAMQRKEQMVNTLKDKNAELDKELNGDPTIANTSVQNLVSRTVDPLGTAINRNDYVPEGLESVHDLHRSWAEEMGQGFMRGVGQAISGTGDIVNAMGALLPGITMLEGNIFGNAIREYGDKMEKDYKSYIPDELLNENISWGSLMNPDFWSKRASEMIPLALEFLVTGFGAGAVARKGAQKLAGRLGREGLETATKLGRATQTTSTMNKLSGLTKVDDVVGSGKGIYGKLIRNVGGKGELTELGVNAAQTFGAGLANNMLAGAMNAAELQRQMKAERNPDGTPKYTDEELADAAAGSFMTNMMYLPIDMLSWGVTYGGSGKMLKNMLPQSQIVKSTGDLLKDTSRKFSFSISPFLKAAGRGASKMGVVAKKAAFEGIEETFQETFEEWAKLRGKAKVTGEDVPSYWDFYNSDENRATKVLAFAVGGLMGGTMNMKEVFNKNAENMAKYYDRVENFRSSIDAEDKLGQEAREYHMQNQMFDLIHEGKEELFGDFLSAMVEKGQVSEEQGEAYEQLFGKIKADYEMATNLNVAGKEALMRSTIEADFLESSIQRDIKAKQEAIKTIRQTFEKGTERDAAIERQVKAFNESIESKLIMLSKAKANRLNLISGKTADPLNIKFVVSKSGKEHFIIDPKTEDFNNMQQTGDNTFTWEKGNSPENIDLAQKQASIVSGLSEEQYKDYVEMTDDEIFERAAKQNKTEVKNLRGRAKDFYTNFKNNLLKNDAQDDSASEKPAEGNENTNGEATKATTDTTEATTDTKQEGDSKEPLSEDSNDEAAKTASEGSEQGNNEQPTEPGNDTKKPETEVKRSENENEFEKAAIDSPEFIDSKKKTIRQKQQEEDKAAEEAFKGGGNTNTQSEKDNSAQGEKSTSGITQEEIAEREEISRKLGNPNSNIAPEQKEQMQKRLAELNKKSSSGRASLISKLFNKKDKTEATQAETRAKLEQRISEFNTAQASAARNIAVRSFANNPTMPVSKNQLDNYLNSAIAKFTYGPNQVQKMIALNRRLKSMNINIDVISAANLFETVGVDATGYAIANTVFIDEKAWEQSDIFMHEMSHIYYRVMSDNPVVKSVIERAQTNGNLVDKLKRMYYEDVRYDIPMGEGIEPQSLSARDLGLENVSREDVIEFMEKEGAKESPMEKQDIINEELFVNYLQGPLSKQFDTFFNPIKDFGRKEVSKGFWAYLKGQSVKYIQDNRDLVEALNNGVQVKPSEMTEYIMKGFTEAIADKKSMLSGQGMASRISKNKAAEEKLLRSISDEKVKQQIAFNKAEIKARFEKSLREKTIDRIKREINSDENLTEQQKQIHIENAIEEYENSFEDTTNFDDFEQVKSLHLKGATRILNSFAKSMNYVKRIKRLQSGKAPSEFDDTLLEDRDALISEMFNLAYETKGNTGKFINAIENSEIQEIDAFNKYLDKMYPDEKLAILNSMAWVMSNYRTISGVKSYVDAKGNHIIENALSEREKNRVDAHMKRIERFAAGYYNDAKEGVDTNAGENPFVDFERSYRLIKQRKGSNEDYLNIIKFLSPHGVRFSNIMKSNSINFKGSPYTVKTVVDNFVKQRVLEQGNNLYISRARSLVEALTDTNRKFTSYSSIQNAEGNFEPSKITNNHLTAEVDGMLDFLSTKPSFKKFKERYGHLNDAAKRKYENPVLRSIYDNFMEGKSMPAITQYFGLKNDMAKMNNLYKNSTDFTQSIEDFMMFNASSKAYLQNMGAFADSPRKFFMQVNKLSYSDMFNDNGSLKPAGQNQLKNAFDIYSKLNENVPENERGELYQTFEDFVRGFNRSVRNERKMWETFGEDLKLLPQLKGYFTPGGKMSVEGNKKLTEYVFNSSVNGLALAEIFNPGVPVKDIVKRNKGNSSPVNTIGNPNLKTEWIIVADANDKSITDSAMYMLREDAEKIIKAGLGVFDLNNGLKLMNYSIDRNNPNFKGRAAYFKGYTTIIDDATLEREPGLRGVADLLRARREKYHQDYFKRNGEYPSDDLLNGQENYLNIAIPMSAIKSDFLTAEQKAKLEKVTFDRLNNAADENNGIYSESDMAAIEKIYDELYYDGDNFLGISGYNFGPQQVMDKITTQSTTPVQFISALIVNGASQGTLIRAEEIQRLIRTDMSNNIDDIIKRLNNMNPRDYKQFILENMDLENMDQAQRLIMEEELNNLNHTAIEDFVLNTLANRLKTAGNKLATAGTIAQQKSNIGYRIKSDYYVNGSNRLQGYTQRENGGQNPLEIVVPKHMKGKVRERQYLSVTDDASVLKYLKEKEAAAYLKSTREQKLETIKSIAQGLAYKNVAGRTIEDGSYGANILDLVGSFQNKQGETIGYYVKGDVVLATRVPSHGPASTGVFEVVDFLSGEGNQTIVSNEFSKVIGSDYDGDALFIQHKSKSTPNFNKALDLSVELWTSPEMAEQIQTSIDFEKEVKAIVGKNKNATEKVFSMSPEYNRNAYNNTMVSKRSIGVIFNMHRLANYLAAYNVELKNPIKIDGKEYTGFSDNEVGQNSRNNNSAKLANIILDNAKWGFADKLGLNDQTINQFALLTNMGVSLSDLNKIMNSDAIAVWTKYKKNNQSPYLRKKSARELRALIQNELGIPSDIKTSMIINTNALDTPQQKANVIAVMEYLESMNSDVLKLSKIMAGHKGINNNPFILEKQLNEFDEVVDNKGENLTFNDSFRNNPDIKAYHDNARKILDVLKKANKIYRTSTEKVLSQIDQELSVDGMTEGQLERASDMLKRFINSRIMGYNNIPEQDKYRVQSEIFDQVYDYMDSLARVELLNGKSGLEQSILFQKALNVYFHQTKDGIDSGRSYISANPAFFNESLSREEKQAVQDEFQELPQELKDNLILYDMMKNGLTGNLSMVHILNESVNFEISNRGFYDQLNKNTPISSDVMQELKELLIANEVTHPDSNIPVLNYDKAPTSNVAKWIMDNKGYIIYNKMRSGQEFYFVANNKGQKQYYHFKGIPKHILNSIEQIGRNKEARERMLSERINENTVVYKPVSGDLNVKAISITDVDGLPPLKTGKSYNMDSKINHLVEANIISEDKKKSNSGRASKIDYHNYNDFRELSRAEYDRVMEYNPAVSDTQKQLAYEAYQAEKEKANELAQTINTASVVKMSDDQLKKLYNKFADKDVYAYSIVTTPIIMEFANRASIEQSKITGRTETGEDISVIASWLNNNNIPSNHPATQALVRKLTGSYKSFVKERSRYVKDINRVTEALYKEKFNLHNNKFFAAIQRVIKSVFSNRSEIYNQLYGNLVETNIIKLPDGQERKEFKFKNKGEIEQLYKEGIISQAEYDFYNTFTKITSELLPYGSPDGKVRRDYIPHTAMGSFEMFSTRGLLGLMVNSQGENDAINDVKMYFKDESGKEVLTRFSDIKNSINSIAIEKGNKLETILEYRKYKSLAKKLLKEGKNQDGSIIEYSNMQTATAFGMGPMSRFASSRSLRAEQMPSMDLNKALIDYVHATLFAHGNANFEGFQSLMPLIDGVMAYNDKNGYKNSYNYVKEVIKDKFINKKDQNLLGPKGDKVVNGLVKGNLLYALGYKGVIIGKGLYAIGNIAIGKYMNIKREGGKAWVTGELRYWGTDKGFGPEALQRRRRAKNILSNLGFMEIDLYDDVSVESRTGLDSIFTQLALLPMSVSENWIQRAQFLGLLTDEEFDKFDDNGQYKEGVEPISQQRLIQLEERVRNTHGKGYTPVDQSRIQTYSLGRMFMQFSRHLPSHIRERFAKEDIDAHGQKYIGSMRQMYITASDIVNNKMSPEAFRKYYASLQPHEKEALQAAMRGMAMITVLGFVDAAMQDSSDKTSADNISRGVIGDANVHFDADKLSYKMVPPALRSVTALLYNGSNNIENAPVE